MFSYINIFGYFSTFSEKCIGLIMNIVINIIVQKIQYVNFNLKILVINTSKLFKIQKYC